MPLRTQKVVSNRQWFSCHPEAQQTNDCPQHPIEASLHNFPGKVKELMSWKRRCSRGLLMIALATSGSLFAHAGELKDIKINIPRRSKLTPVQRLNREGVEAIRKH